MKHLYSMLLCLFILPAQTMAASITSLDVDMVVHDDASLTVHETIFYNFGNEKQHAIKRRIQHRADTSLGRWDKQLTIQSVKMDGLPVAWDIYRDAIVIGVSNAKALDNPDIDWGEGSLTGTHQFAIIYDIKYGIVPRNDLDNIAWHVTGHDWPVVIQKASITVHLPKALHHNNIKSELFVSRKNSVGRASESWPDAHTFTAQYINLPAKTGFSISLAYASGLLSRSAKDIATITAPGWLRTHWHWFSFVLLSGLMMMLWLRYGRDPDQGQVAPCYEAPHEIDVALAALLLNAKLDQSAVYATTLELAAAKYLSIGKGESGLIFRRLKSADDLPKYKQTLMHALFKHGDELNCGNMTKTPKRELRTAYAEVIAQIYAWSVDKGLMRTNPALITGRFRKVGYIVVSLCIAVALVDSLARFDGTSIIPLLIGLITWFFLVKVVQARQLSWKIVNSIVGIGLIVWMLKIANLESVSAALEMFFIVPIWLQTLLLPMVFVFSNLMPAKTTKGADLSLQLMGLKEFMQRVNSDELQSRLKDDPTYMHKLTPYAVAFDVLAHWAGLMHQETNIELRDRFDDAEFMDFDDDMDITEAMDGFENMGLDDNDDDDDDTRASSDDRE